MFYLLAHGAEVHETTAEAAAHKGGSNVLFIVITATIVLLAIGAVWWLASDLDHEPKNKKE